MLLLFITLTVHADITFLFILHLFFFSFPKIVEKSLSFLQVQSILGKKKYSTTTRGESTPDFRPLNKPLGSFVASFQISSPRAVEGNTRFEAGIDEEATDEIVAKERACRDSCSYWPLTGLKCRLSCQLDTVLKEEDDTTETHTALR